MEKIHGTSAHVSFRLTPCAECGGGGGSAQNLGLPCEGCDGKPQVGVGFFSGGEKYEKFVSLFDKDKLSEAFTRLGMDKVIVFGEAYGGKCQGMSNTYGKELKFVAFDVKIGNLWLSVPKAEKVALDLGFDFVHYVRIPATVEALDAQRDAFSTQAIRNGCGADKIAEGVVARPLIELRANNGDRVIAKHKRPEWRETTSVRKVVDPAKLAVLDNAKAIADEWVTDVRLQHVLDKMPEEKRTINSMRDIISAMVEDVLREGKGELVEGKDVHSAIGHRTVKLFKASLNRNIRTEAE